MTTKTYASYLKQRSGGESFITHKCPVCGKKFVPAPMHVYKTTKGQAVCSWSCLCEYRRKKNKNKKEKKMILKFTLDKGAFPPIRAHKWDAGLDLRCPEGEAQLIPSYGSAIFDTGVHIQIPHGYVGFLKSKSGLNVNHGITGEGVIDSEYCGSIKVKLYNNSDYDYYVGAGDKITQLVILPCECCEVEQTDTLEETERGSGGFGSTGK